MYYEINKLLTAQHAPGNSIVLIATAIISNLNILKTFI